MKKIIIGLIIGFILGHFVTYHVMNHEAPPAVDAVAEEDKSDEPLKLTKGQQERAGLQITTPEDFSWRPSVKGYGRVLDAATLAAEYSDIVSATAAAEASTQEFNRQKVLRAGDNASVRAYEQAEAAMKHDTSALTAAQAKLLADWGPAIAGRKDLDTLVGKLIARQAALARVDLPAGENPPRQQWTVEVAPIAGNATAQTAEVLGPAPSADMLSQGQAYLVLLGDSAPPPGASLLASFYGAGDPQKGMRLPRSAIVYNDGQAFVYLQTGLDDKTGEMSFDRRRVDLGPVIPDSVFVLKGLTPKDKVITTGAQQILSEELKASAGASPD